MLEFLSIKGFAIIDELALPFNPGLTVLTGETGAGKSIIVDALQAVLGEKVYGSVVRSGEDSASVQAVFRDPGANLPEGISCVDDEIMILREIRREGRGRASVNGTMITIPHLKEMGDHMVDLHGQHEHQSLLKTAVHLQALDSFASLENKKQEFSLVFRELVKTRERLDTIERDKKDRLARLDYLRYVTKELQSAELDPDEEERLCEEEGILGAAEKLLHTASTALEELYQGEGSVVETVRGSAGNLKQMMETDGRLREVVELIEGAGAQLEEAGHFLRDYTGAVQADPHRLQEIHERLAVISTLRKKYGPSMKEVLGTLEEARQELALIEEGDTDLETLQSRELDLAARAGKLAFGLSQDRKKKALLLESSVKTELQDLAMEKVRFSVAFQENDMSETGIDEAEFLISPNPGEPLMPLRKIASGGELSRVMLALKKILAGADGVGTLVFDEVDAGIGGRVAAVLGRKLQNIASHHQVLCITHLAPVAACAHHHIVVEKSEERGRTVVRTRYLDDDERVDELARMMGGIEVSSGIVRSARELLEGARG
ncbi:MAG: DNA repair protein RecN [bacterium]|nr:DNA repair protein RecN [bacterium]MDT8365984.1 DNA repair protein RecN [bacterium]